jgi:hypothetical protein
MLPGYESLGLEGLVPFFSQWCNIWSDTIARCMEMNLALPLSWRWQEPADSASDQMLRLQLDNLELRFRTIERETLPTDHDKSWYDEIANAFACRQSTPGLDDATGQTKALTWDDAYRLETEIGCMLHGDRLRQEIADSLRWAIGDNVPQAIDLQNDYANLTKSINDTAKNWGRRVARLPVGRDGSDSLAQQT